MRRDDAPALGAGVPAATEGVREVGLPDQREHVLADPRGPAEHPVALVDVEQHVLADLRPNRVPVLVARAAHERLRDALPGPERDLEQVQRRQANHRPRHVGRDRLAFGRLAEHDDELVERERVADAGIDHRPRRHRGRDAG